GNNFSVSRKVAPAARTHTAASTAWHRPAARVTPAPLRSDAPGANVTPARRGRGWSRCDTATSEATIALRTDRGSATRAPSCPARVFRVEGRTQHAVAVADQRRPV